MPHYNKPDESATFCGVDSATNDICDICDRSVRNLTRKQFKMEPLTDEEWQRAKHRLLRSKKSTILFISGGSIGGSRLAGG